MCSKLVCDMEQNVFFFFAMLQKTLNTIALWCSHSCMVNGHHDPNVIPFCEPLVFSLNRFTLPI